MSNFEVRGIVITETNARKFYNEYIGQDWTDKLREGFDHMLKEAKKRKLTVKERHALYKWLYDIRPNRRI